MTKCQRVRKYRKQANDIVVQLSDFNKRKGDTMNRLRFVKFEESDFAGYGLSTMGHIALFVKQKKFPPAGLRQIIAIPFGHET